MARTPSAVTHGLGVAAGLLVAGYAAQSYLWYGYMRAAPDVGAVSTSPGFGLTTAAVFVVGVTVAYASFVRGLAVTLSDAQTAV